MVLGSEKNEIKENYQISLFFFICADYYIKLIRQYDNQKPLQIPFERMYTVVSSAL